MGVYINGMKMPKSCCECNIRYEMFCPLLHRFIADEGRRHNCPLGDVPTPHGKLIDADAIPYKKIMYDEETDEFYYGVTKPYIDRMPTIIEAEE